MTDQHATPTTKQWLQVVTATLLVAGCPIAVVWWLRASGTVSSAALAVALGMGLSLGASHVGRAVWESRPGSEDLLFSELMIWGFLHRRRTQQRLARAFDVLGAPGEPERRVFDGLSTRGQAKLLRQLVTRMETRDPYLHGHSRRVARHSWMIARRMGLPREEVARIRTAAAIHDVGKINTPKAILHKPGALTDEEYDVIKRHPGDGAEMVEALGDAALTAMVRDHHERLDGSGYPHGLGGAEISLGARIIAVADTFDAITSARPYRCASPHKKAMDILKDEAGTRLDPAVVRAFNGHYAGRGPLALWSFVAGIPERALTWLSGSATGVAAAAKVAAIAALLGGAAVTTSTLGLPDARSHPVGAHAASAVGFQASAVNSTPSRRSAGVPPPSAPKHRHVRSHRPAGARQPPHMGAPAGIPNVGAGQGVAPGTSGKAGETKGESAPEGTSHKNPGEGRSEERPVKGKSETPGKGAETPREAGGGETHGKSEEAAREAHGRSEEAQAKSEEAHGKSEEAHGGTSEAAHGKSGEASEAEAHAKSEEAHGKAEEKRKNAAKTEGESA
jgi:hypothetical protein